MLKLGFATAILPDLSFEEVLAYAAAEGFACLEVMCWPAGKAERRYAGVTHIDVTDFTEADVANVHALLQKYNVSISGLGYYPNPLDPDPAAGQIAVEHIRKVIRASAMLGVNVVNTFIGRDWTKSMAENWKLFDEVWPDIIRYAEEQGVRVGIENCPMLFSDDEWPGGKNMAISPEIWREMFRRIPSPNFGLNFDPSHLIWQHIDYVRAIREFSPRFVHVHAKDEKIDPDLLYERGILGLKWHSPKLPGLGTVDWGKFFSALTDSGYRGPVVIEVEDRAYEATQEDRKASIAQSRRYLLPFMP